MSLTIKNGAKVEFYYDGDKLPEIFTKEAMVKLMKSFSVKDCHTMLKDAISHHVKTMYNKELSKEDRSAILGLISELNDTLH